MSATQANPHPELDNLFAFESSQQHLQAMSSRPDMLRQAMPQIPQSMLGLNSAQFSPSQQQSSQAPQSQNSMSLLPNPGNPNQPMSMLSGQSANNTPLSAQQRYQMSMNAANQGGRMAMPTRSPHPMAQSATAPGAHLGAMHNSLQNMPFMMPQSANWQPRRVASQPSLGQLNAIHSAQQPPGGLTMGMNAQTSMPGQLRQVTQQQHQQRQSMGMDMRMPAQPPQMSPDMQMSLGRGNGGMPQSMTRSASTSAQLMSSLTPPQPGLSSGHPGVQPGHNQPNFQNSIPLPQQHQQPQTSSSPRPGSHPPPHAPSMAMNTPGPSHAAPNRPQMPPDNPMFMGFQTPQYPQLPPQLPHNPTRIPSNSAFPFVPSSTPPTQHGGADLSQSMSGSLGNPPIPANRVSGFPLTPAQQFADMQAAGETYGAHFAMPPSSQVNPPPPRPPSHSNHRPNQGMPPQQPPPQQQQPQQLQNQHHSPSHSDPMSSHPPPQQQHQQQQPQRPQSQPQGQPGRPPSQTGGPSHTPHMAQQPLPATAGMHPGRMGPPSQHGPGQPPPHPSQQPQGPTPIAPRPPTATSNAGPSGSMGRPPSIDGGPVQNIPAAPGQRPMYAAPLHSPLNRMPDGRPESFSHFLGLGQGLLRLLQFSATLAGESKTKLQLSYWDHMVKEYFTRGAVVKVTLWKDNQRTEAKPFEIGVPILPRFFLVTTQSGVKSMSISLDGARERLVTQSHAVIDCMTAVWTYKYSNGYTVTLRGPLTCHVVLTSTTNSTSCLKFDMLSFEANYHDKYIALDAILDHEVSSPKTPRARSVTLSVGSATPAPPNASQQQQQQQHQQQHLQQQQQLQLQREEDRKWEEPRRTFEHASIPGEPVNAFGIPQATMRCLELAESVGQMADLIGFSNETKLGPLDALGKFASRLREGAFQNPGMGPMGPNAGGMPGVAYAINGVVSTPAVTLYPGTAPNAPNSHAQQQHQQQQQQQMLQQQQQQQMQPATPQNPPDSPQKQHKTTPQQATPSSSSAAAGSSSTQNTPSLANASLKRKNTTEPTSSPTTATVVDPTPPMKRSTRKRGRTNG